jgi:hypothetical protein
VVAPTPRAPSALGWPERWDPNYLALGETVVPRNLLAMVEEIYPNTITWLVRGKIEPVRGVGVVIYAMVAPADVAKSEAADKRRAAVEAARPTGPCPACGHEHQGEPLAFICIGCACPETPGKPVEADEAGAHP